VDAQRETDVESGDVDETTSCLAEVNDAADDANVDDMSRAESACDSEDIRDRCLDAAVHCDSDAEFHDDVVDEMTPCLAADDDRPCPSGVPFTRPADSRQVFADNSKHKHTYSRLR